MTALFGWIPTVQPAWISGCLTQAKACCPSSHGARSGLTDVSLSRNGKKWGAEDWNQLAAV